MLKHYYYINLRSLIILFSGDMYLSLGIYVLISIVSEVFCDEFFEAFIILLAISLPIKLPVASAVF